MSTPTPGPWIAEGYDLRQKHGRMIAYFGPHHTPADEYPMSCRLQDEANCQWVAALPAALAAAQQEAAHYMSVAQKATDDLARLRADNLTAHQMACAAGLERDQLRSELAEAKVERETVAEASLRSLEAYIDKLKQFAERAEKAEVECLEQARLLGMSGEREADLLGKLERLAKDKARLDWLEAHALPQHSPNISISDLGRHYNGFPGSFRAAIDAAMSP